MVRLINAAGVYPEVLQTVNGSLLSAKPDLSVPTLISASTFGDVLERNFLFFISPSMREYSIWWDVISKIFGQAKIAIFELQKTHGMLNLKMEPKYYKIAYNLVITI